MKLRLKGESEWKDYKLCFNEGDFCGVIFGEAKVKQPLPSLNGENDTIEVSEPILLPLDCFDMWEEPNWNVIRNQAAIAAMQGILSGRDKWPDKQSVAQFSALMADRLIEELKQT